jgi:hypothetical protein
MRLRSRSPHIKARSWPTLRLVLMEAMRASLGGAYNERCRFTRKGRKNEETGLRHSRRDGAGPRIPGPAEAQSPPAVVKKKTVRRKARLRSRSGSDNIADQLNAQELVNRARGGPMGPYGGPMRPMPVAGPGYPPPPPPPVWYPPPPRPWGPWWRPWRPFW